MINVVASWLSARSSDRLRGPILTSFGAAAFVVSWLTAIDARAACAIVMTVGSLLAAVDTPRYNSPRAHELFLASPR